MLALVVLGKSISLAFLLVSFTGRLLWGLPSSFTSPGWTIPPFSAPTQLQDFCTWLCWTLWGLHGPLSQPVQVSLYGILSLQPVNCSTQFGVIRKFWAWIPLSMSPKWMLNTASPSIDPWETQLVTSLHLSIEPWTATLHLTYQPIPCSLSGPSITSMPLHLKRRMSRGTVPNALHKFK